MTCREIEEAGLAERFVAGKLTTAEREAFENHFFACPVCLERVEILQALPLALGAPGPRPPYARWAAIAACLAVAAGGTVVWKLRDRPPPPSLAAPAPQIETASLAQLATFAPPPYDAPALRGSRTPALQAFEEGMERYRAGALQDAIARLSIAARLDPEDPAALFFLGVCQLLTGDAAGGTASLHRVEAMGPTPYLEEARFYRAKGLIALGDPAAARTLLAEVAGMNGRLAAEAGDLSHRLSAF